MRVLVTGSAGFIGSAVADALVARGDEPVRIDLMLPQAHGGTTEPSDTHRLDVRDVDQWRHLLDGVDAVCHQAALVGAGVRIADLPDYASHNDLATAALLAAMHEAGVHRLVLASSMVVYGEGRYTCPDHGRRTPEPRDTARLDAGDFDNHCDICGRTLAWELVDESTPIDPRSAYAASKAAQEHYAAAWARHAGGGVVALRYHNVYGPGMPRDTPYSGVAAMFRSALERGDPPTVFEDGAQMRDFVHVADVVRANLSALDVGAADGRFAAYNVCSGEPVSIRQVADLVVQGSGGGPAPVVTGDYRPGDVRHIVASPARASAALGFTAAIGPEAGLRELATAPLRR